LQFAVAQQVTLAQKDIPRLPTDTLPTDRPEVRLVTFSDGTFRYIPTNPYHFSSAPAYTSHWDTINLFAYRTLPLSELPGTVDLEFSDSHGFHSPVTGRVISPYGRRSGRDHNGVDIRVAHGEPIYAAFDGITRLSRWNSGGFGNIVIVRHPSGLETWYGHLSRRAVASGEWVRAGQVIGYGGRTGRASAVHLHFETRYADQSFDPERLIDFQRGALRVRLFALHKEYFNIRSREGDGNDPDVLYAEISDDESRRADSLGAGATDGPLLAMADGTGSDVSPSGPSKPADPEPEYHKIRSGDTLLALAMEYHTTVANICALNGITRTSTRRIGRNLRIR
jgi:hypothetical protein